MYIYYYYCLSNYDNLYVCSAFEQVYYSDIWHMINAWIIFFIYNCASVYIGISVFTGADENVLSLQPNQQQQMSQQQMSQQQMSQQQMSQQQLSQQQMAQMNQSGSASSQSQPGMTGQWQGQPGQMGGQPMGGPPMAGPPMAGPPMAGQPMAGQPMGSGGKWSCQLSEPGTKIQVVWYFGIYWHRFVQEDERTIRIVFVFIS